MTSLSKVPKLNIDYGQLAIVVDNVLYYPTKNQWNIYKTLWESHGDYVTVAQLSYAADLQIDNMRWHIVALRKNLGKDVILTHPRGWGGYRLNIPIHKGTDFDYREEA